MTASGEQTGHPCGRWALVNGRLILPREVVVGKALVGEGDKIVGVADPDALGDEVERIDVGGRTIAPGLVDMHTHGALGHTFNEPTAEAFEVITAANAAHGVTALLATVATAPIPALVRCLEAARAWMPPLPSPPHAEGMPPLSSPPHAEGMPPLASPPPAGGGVGGGGAQVLGVHLEGPYFNPAQKGAQDPDHLRVPDDGSPAVLLEHAGVLRVMTFAPELPGALELTTECAARGIVPAAGHSAAQDTHVLAAMRLGLRHAVHLWSGQSSTIRQGPWRRPGLLEAVLAYDELTAEMIADHRHLPSTLMRLAYKCKGADRLCVVSDATAGAGMPEGTRFRLGGVECQVQDGVGMLLDRSAFAGSTTLLNRMVAILVEAAGVPLVEAVRMASLTPARIVGLDGRKGSLEPGKDADVAIFEDDLTVWRTMIAGRWVFVA